MATWKNLPQFILTERAIVATERGARIPYYNHDGSLHATRVYDGNRCYWTPAGRGVQPYGLETLVDDWAAGNQALLFAEGESDALTLATIEWSHSTLIGADVLGVPGAFTWRPEWSKWAEPYGAVYVFTDGDIPGERFGWTVRRDIPRARIVQMPAGEDVRSMVQRDGAEALEPLIAASETNARLVEAFQTCATLEEAAAFLRGEAATDAS